MAFFLTHGDSLRGAHRDLNSKQGGENEKLIFKILKRGEKLKLDTAKSEADLVDGGLPVRSDRASVPVLRQQCQRSSRSLLKLCRWAMCGGRTGRQRGRYRQFMQCDIDILGEASNLAEEIELILATTTPAWADWNLRISPSASMTGWILKAMAAYSGFPGRIL